MSKHVGEKCGKRADGDRTDGWTDGDPDGDPDGHHHTIIRPVTYKNELRLQKMKKSRYIAIRNSYRDTILISYVLRYIDIL